MPSSNGPRQCCPTTEAFAWALRGRLFRETAETGAVPSREALRQDLGATLAEVDQALRFLAGFQALALDEAGEVLMAHPFSAVETPFRVTTAGGCYWANCAWDAIATPMLLETSGRVRVRCPGSGESISLDVDVAPAAPAGALRSTEVAVLFPVPARRFWDDIRFT